MKTATTNNHIRLLIIIKALIITSFPSIAKSSNNLITPQQPLTKDQTLVSPNQNFELGFFKTPSSGNWHVGIWYKSIRPRIYAWVLNRDEPIFNSSSSDTMALRINNPDGGDGNLILTAGGSPNPIWSTNISTPRGTTSTTVAELLDSGNFVLRLENAAAGDYLWQGFDHPTDTLLPGMNLGWDKKTGFNRFLTSWKTLDDDPSTGDYAFKMDINGFPEIYLYKKNTVEYRSGPWNGVRFSGVPEMKQSPLLSFHFYADEEQVYYSFDVSNDTVLSRLTLSPAGLLERFTWVPVNRIWSKFWYAPKDQCDEYRECGVHGICDPNASPVCKCLTGFAPKNQQAWNLRDGSEGCVRVSGLSCESDEFLTMSYVKLPESEAAFVDREMGLDDCREMCKKKCSCSGFSSANVTGGGSGCVIWTEELYDMRQYAVSEGGQDFYIRVSRDDWEKARVVAPALDNKPGNKSKHIANIVIIIPIIVGILLLASLAILYKKKRAKSRTALLSMNELRGARERSQDYLLNAPAAIISKRDHNNHSFDLDVTEDLDLPLFHITTLLIATDEFSEANKLGQGGFGSVYKGTLEGQEIAVKRLSKNSGQGAEEFMNEVRLIARLQHRNLVRLLGCCVDMEEKMLVYEYMENKSLDFILFKKNGSSILDWSTRFNIVCGIARGLLYLHQDSRLRIIHRDLKASNILLDKDMNPKISDFGMARIFGSDQTEANTKRVVGTYGYMSPEYAMDGLFSTKSDVFSFGVLVLEIISGQRNRGFYQTNNQLNLLAYAWKLYKDGRALQLMDSSSGEKHYSESEVIRCVQVGLLCVQEHAEDRPNMSDVVLMLSSDGVSMPKPKNPGYFLGGRSPHNLYNDSSSSKVDETFTANQVTVTILDGR